MRTFLFWVCLCLSGVAWTEPAKILVLGDSLSAAYNLRQEEGWVALLNDKLQASQPQRWQVVNASISGETTSGGLTRLPAALELHRPQLVIIALGANDGLRGLQLGAMRSNLTQMVQEAKASGAAAALVGIEIPPNYGEAYRSRFRAVFKDVADAEKVPLLPFLLVDIADELSNFQGDLIHPTAEAQPRILDTVWPWLEPQLQMLEGTAD